MKINDRDFKISQPADKTIPLLKDKSLLELAINYKLKFEGSSGIKLN